MAKPKKRKVSQELPFEDGILTHADRPKTRLECYQIPRPCPYVSCRYHLYLDVFEGGVLKINHKEVELADMPYTCALDAAEQGEMELDQIASALNLTRERVRQILEESFRKIRGGVDKEVIKILASFAKDDSIQDFEIEGDPLLHSGPQYRDSLQIPMDF